MQAGTHITESQKLMGGREFRYILRRTGHNQEEFAIHIKKSPTTISRYLHTDQVKLRHVDNLIGLVGEQNFIIAQNEFRELEKKRQGIE